ncbi:tagatose 1,6-diphosphate aldolase [Nakamurella endophytica]|uniref:Tagatose 1,6-diphosphate aldolase n=1 Tax=Nakamurella endophytica TaxID=1748367 RepID=A0A917TAJ2_9ACTN|nr:tagatose 1,6-diphosphate aldolase [Nakamurella endophytica]GGM16617.1 tagatose 1,6-diphosphate aldolase [Nakamurella endophytica]
MPTLDPGKIRGLSGIVSDAGFFEICALDHLSDFAELLAPDPSTVGFEDIVTAKDQLVRELSPSVSAFLLDARYGAQVLATGALPARTGLMFSIEDEDYKLPAAPRRTRHRTGWSLDQIKLIGADMAKLLWFYRPDLDPDTAEHQRFVLRSLVEQCARLSLPLVVEPIWYPVDGEDPTSEQWRQDRVEGILTSAFHAAAAGIDMLKVEFPGYVETSAGQDAALAACQRLHEGIDLPWVILSAGVGYEDFKTQVEISSRAGASGYLAGRSIWRDAVSHHDPAERAAGIQAARGRLDELNKVARSYGRPYSPARPLADVLTAMPDGWFAGWHPQG